MTDQTDRQERCGEARSRASHLNAHAAPCYDGPPSNEGAYGGPPGWRGVLTLATAGPNSRRRQTLRSPYTPYHPPSPAPSLSASPAWHQPEFVICAQLFFLPPPFGFDNYNDAHGDAENARGCNREIRSQPCVMKEVGGPRGAHSLPVEKEVMLSVRTNTRPVWRLSSEIGRHFLQWNEIGNH